MRHGVDQVGLADAAPLSRSYFAPVAQALQMRSTV